MSVCEQISRSKSQNLTTFESSSGASTSSKTQIGAGLVKNTAKIMASAVSACSPPDNSDNDCMRLPGGLARISRLASNGSSASVNRNSAVPPPNNLLNRVKMLVHFKTFKQAFRPGGLLNIAARIGNCRQQITRSVSISVMRATSPFRLRRANLPGQYYRVRGQFLDAVFEHITRGRLAGSSYQQSATASGAQ